MDNTSNIIFILVLVMSVGALASNFGPKPSAEQRASVSLSASMIR